MLEVKVSNRVISHTKNEYIIEQIINGKVFIICCFSPSSGLQSYVEFAGIKHNFNSNGELLYILEKHTYDKLD